LRAQRENSMGNSKIGSIGWFDLTVENAEEIRDFYSSVVGWKSTPVAMGEYDDYCMNQPDDDTTVAGICHARGANKDIPPQWLMYITVENFEESCERCIALGGKILSPVRNSGQGIYCVIQDPAGAVAALYQDTGNASILLAPSA
jgi:uncharacterized protein